MAHFAQKILVASREILPSRLQLRVGVHSGPLVARVLRNHKDRYQLFGDMINTASRMKSLGFPGRIQLSDVTAACPTFDGWSIIMVTAMRRSRDC
jgi:class 3 adenylate cyclase